MIESVTVVNVGVLLAALIVVGFLMFGAIAVGLPRERGIIGGAGSAVRSLVSGTKDNVVDTQIRNAAVTANDTWTAINAFAGTALSDVQVPAGAKYLGKISISVGVAASAQGAAYSAVRFRGNGFVKGGIYNFLGPAFGRADGLTAAGGQGVTVLPTDYLCAIEVKPAGTITIEAGMGGDDIGALNVAVTLTFTVAPLGPIVDMDFRQAVVAALNTATQLTNVLNVASANFSVPAGAKWALPVPVMAYEPTASTNAALAAIAAWVLSGNGLAKGGSYSFVGAAGGFIISGTSSVLLTSQPEQTADVIEVVGANQIRADGYMLGATDIGDANAVLGLVYLGGA